LNLGSFEKDESSGKISGVLYGVNMYPTKLTFEPAVSEKGSPYYKIFTETQQATVEAGAAWPKTSKNENARPSARTSKLYEREKSALIKHGLINEAVTKQLVLSL
jgi:hypothetical protein